MSQEAEVLGTTLNWRPSGRADHMTISKPPHPKCYWFGVYLQAIPFREQNNFIRWFTKGSSSLLSGSVVERQDLEVSLRTRTLWVKDEWSCPVPSMMDKLLQWPCSSLPATSVTMKRPYIRYWGFRFPLRMCLHTCSNSVQISIATETFGVCGNKICTISGPGWRRSLAGIQEVENSNVTEKSWFPMKKGTIKLSVASSWLSPKSTLPFFHHKSFSWTHSYPARAYICLPLLEPGVRI